MVKGVDVSVATRARIVLWGAEGHLQKQVAALAGVSRPTVETGLSHWSSREMAVFITRTETASPPSEVLEG